MRIFHVCVLLLEDTDSMWWHRFGWWMPRLGRLWAPYIIIEPQWEREGLAEIEQKQKKDDTSLLIIIIELVLIHSSVLSSAIQHFILQRLSDHTVIYLVTASMTLPQNPWSLTVFDLKKKGKPIFSYHYYYYVVFIYFLCIFRSGWKIADKYIKQRDWKKNLVN